MAQRTNTRVAALEAHRWLEQNDAALNKSHQRPSGIRRIHGAEDAARHASRQKVVDQPKGPRRVSSHAANPMNDYLAHAEYLLPKLKRLRCSNCDLPLEQGIPGIKLCGPCLEIYLAIPPKGIESQKSGHLELR